MSDKQPEEKQYSLKNIELQIVQNINERHNAALLDFLSFVAIERLAYNVTKSTQFRVDNDGKLYIRELDEEKEKVEVAQ